MKKYTVIDISYEMAENLGFRGAFIGKGSYGDIKHKLIWTSRINFIDQWKRLYLILS